MKFNQRHRHTLDRGSMPPNCTLRLLLVGISGVAPLSRKSWRMASLS